MYVCVFVYFYDTIGAHNIEAYCSVLCICFDAYNNIFMRSHGSKEKSDNAIKYKNGFSSSPVSYPIRRGYDNSPPSISKMAQRPFPTNSPYPIELYHGHCHIHTPVRVSIVAMPMCLVRNIPDRWETLLRQIPHSYQI